MPFPPVEDQLAELLRGTVDVLPADGLRAKLERSARTGEPLLVKLGCDPSRPDLHIGHAVVLRKLRQFQDLGHRAVLIVGDFTARIGDPSGKSKTRPALTAAETRANGQSYVDQAALVLDTAPDKLTVVHNGDWLDPMTFADVVRLSAQMTVAQMLERDDFKTRYTGGQPISLHEFLYPLAQGQDSVHLGNDVELGGTDQTFNLLVGRSLMEAAGMDPQVCLTLPILEGTDGVQKMSKSLDNAIGLTDAPEEIYGRTLSIPDERIVRWVTLATDVPLADLPAWEARAERDPRNAKHDLAFRLVEMLHDRDAAEAARAHFEKTVVQGGVPDEIDEVAIPEATLSLVEILRRAALAASNGEARRLIGQNAVSLDGEKEADVMAEIDVAARAPFVLKVGKRRFARVVRA